jgi:FtsH-binding integral membrane protein
VTKWQSWLDSLSSKGGQLLILCLFVIFLLALVIWVTSRDAGDSQAATVILSTFSAFAGALLTFLTGGQRKTDSSAPTQVQVALENNKTPGDK